MRVNSLFVQLLAVITAVQAYVASGNSFEVVKRQIANPNTSTNLTVDLGYATYQGYTNSTTGLNNFQGIRYAQAAPPLGALRWQRPQPPTSNRSSTIQANAYGPTCPQSLDASYAGQGARGVYGSEDCLFLNVQSPPGAKDLPVLVWIHGGGYGAGNGRQDLSTIINANNKSFVGVSIQYRLGAFGFMSSDEIFRNGVVNAGLLDQHFALQWVQAYISLFGGNASQVSISGESAGGGSVMLQDMAYGGSQGDSLFVNTIAASPYLPMQYGYKDWVPSQSYYAFAIEAGCPPSTAYGSSPTTVFQCLVGKDSMVLQNASFNVSASGTYGTWGFLPVTDGVFIQDIPSRQLLQKRVNGRRVLTGNNADEGPLFVPQINVPGQGIRTEDDLLAWLRLTFPLFTNDDIAKILLYYPSSNASTDPNAPQYPTNGYTGATAVNESVFGTGQQQRANNIYAETTFVCPSYWMAEAYSDGGVAGTDRAGYKYQYSVPDAYHSADVAGYFGPTAREQGADFERAFMTIWGNFITKNNPSISQAIASGTNGTVSATSAATNFPPFHIYAPYMLNLNNTGGQPFVFSSPTGTNLTEYGGPGLQNNFTSVNAYTWEGGRGYRCDFWRSVGAIVPE